MVNIYTNMLGYYDWPDDFDDETHLNWLSAAAIIAHKDSATENITVG